MEGGLKVNDDYDLSRLSDDEMRLLERLLTKAAGEHDEAVFAPFVIEFVRPHGAAE
jgi:hypothetical protein